MSFNDVEITQQPNVINKDITQIPTTDLDINQTLENEVNDVEYRTGWRTNYCDNPRMRSVPDLGANGIYQQASSAQYLTFPNSAAFAITGDIDIRVRVAFDDWSTGGTPGQELLGKYGASGNRSWLFRITNTGLLQFFWYPTGTTAPGTFNSTASVYTAGFVDGQPGWVRATLDVNNGAGGWTLTYFTSFDGTTWTQLGSQITNAGVTSIFVSTAQLRTQQNANAVAVGYLLNYQVFNGIAGTLVLDADIPNNWNPGVDLFSFITNTGQIALSTIQLVSNSVNDANQGYYITNEGQNATRTTSDFKYGGASYLLTGGTATSQGLVFRITSGFRIPWTPSQRVSVGIWVKVPTGSPQLSLRIRRSQWTAVTGGTQNADATTGNTIVNDTLGWVLLTGNFTVDASSNALGFRVEYGATPPANAQFLASAFIIEALNTGSVGDYFDGSFTLVAPDLSPVTRWRGTADASISDLTYAADGTLTISQTLLTL